MSNIFFTSDPHFGHFNLQNGLRKFESDELVIENWNKQVCKRDRVYILGDFCMQKPSVIRTILPRLKGDIILIGGNHDNLPCSREFMRQGIPIIGSLTLHDLIFTHIPIHPTQLDFGWKGNVHGHIHIVGDIENRKYEPKTIADPRYYNVNVEFHDYQLVPLDTIDKYYQQLNQE